MHRGVNHPRTLAAVRAGHKKWAEQQRLKRYEGLEKVLTAFKEGRCERDLVVRTVRRVETKAKQSGWQGCDKAWRAWAKRNGLLIEGRHRAKRKRGSTCDGGPSEYGSGVSASERGRADPYIEIISGRYKPGSGNESELLPE